MNKFKRITGEKAWAAGVCAGVAYGMGVPTWLVRALTAIAIVGYGVGLLPYILLAIFMPKWSETPADYTEQCE